MTAIQVHSERESGASLSTRPYRRVRTEIEALATQAFGAGVRVRRLKKLNIKTRTHVARVWAERGDGSSRTFIAKFLNPAAREQEPAALDEFAEELHNYRFLMASRNRFALFPRLLAHTEGIFLLEDLGVDSYQFRSRQEILTSLATTFATLHLSTQGRASELAELRGVDLSIDARYYSQAGNRLLFDKGAWLVADYAKIMIGVSATDWESWLQEVLHDIAEPGPLSCFVHDDLADRRQVVVRDGTTYLLDFEHAKFAHALQDLAKLLIGKVERDANADAMIYNHPHIPIELADIYRAAWRREGGCELGDAAWHRHLASAVIFQTLVILGRVTELRNRLFRATLADSIRQVLERSAGHLSRVPAHHDVRRVFATLAARVMS